MKHGVENPHLRHQARSSKVEPSSQVGGVQILPSNKGLSILVHPVAYSTEGSVAKDSNTKERSGANKLFRSNPKAFAKHALDKEKIWFIQFPRHMWIHQGSITLLIVSLDTNRVRDPENHMPSNPSKHLRALSNMR